jgi:hypothetical protein
MKINNTILLLFLLLSGFLHAQTEEQLLIGKIVVDSLKVEGVNIRNLRTEKTAVTNELGIFSIPVQVGDALVFSAVNLEIKRKVIQPEDLKQQRLLIKMSIKMTNLDEVVVNDNNGVSAESLGIIPANQKKYTPAERKLYTAKSGILDPLLNKISGRTSMLKKEAQVERNERLLRQLDGWFAEKYYTTVLEIPKEYIKGFQYFLIEDDDFVRALRAKNKTLTLFLVKRLALNYKNELNEEAPTKVD